MKLTALAVFLVGTCLLCFSPTGALAQDWSQWRGVDQDGAVSGFVAPETWPSNLTQVWSVPVGVGDASPAFVDGKLYVFSRLGDEEILHCLDAADGREIWRTAQGTIEVKGAARGHSGPRSSPAVANGAVAVVSVAGVLSCLDAKNGDVRWRKDEFPNEYPDYYVSASPMIVDDLCVAQLGGKKSGALVAYDLADGSERWRWDGDPPSYASPALMSVAGNKQIVTLTNDNLVGISASDGQRLWQTPFPIPTRSTNSASPVVDGQTVIYSGQNRGVKAVRIEREGDDYAVKEVWSTDELSTAFNTPVLNGGFLYGISYKTNLYCIDARTGEVTWIGDERHERFSTIVDAGSALFALHSKGGLTAFEPSGAAYKQLAQYQVSESPTYSYPIVAGNRVYIQDQNAITAWAIE